MRGHMAHVHAVHTQVHTQVHTTSARAPSACMCMHVHDPCLVGGLLAINGASLATSGQSGPMGCCNAAAGDGRSKLPTVRPCMHLNAEAATNLTLNPSLTLAPTLPRPLPLTLSLLLPLALPRPLPLTQT